MTLQSTQGPRKIHAVGWSLIIATLVVFALSMQGVAWIVDWLWMSQLQFENVFWRILGTRIGLFAAAFFPLWIYFWLNLRATRNVVHEVAEKADGTYTTTLANRLKSGWAAPLTGGGAAILALFIAFFFQGAWQRMLLFEFGGFFNSKEPILNLDIGFYVFQLPFLDALFVLLLTAATVGVAIHVGVLYVLGFLRSWKTANVRIKERATVLIAGNGAFAAIVWSAGYLLDRFHLLYGSPGTVAGPGYTDVHILLPALWVMAGVTIGVAMAFIWTLRTKRARDGMIALGIGAILHVALLWILPAAIQAFVVSPNELELERPYLANNIRYTREGFALDRTVERDFPGTETLTMADMEEHRQTVRNIRLWDYRPLLKTFRQLQEIRLYYRFYDVDVDRYQTADGLRQVMLSARELTPDLPRSADTWVNRTLQYTHGYGLAMSLAAQEGNEGSPSLIVKDLPPVTRDGIRAKKVALYYGEHTPDYRIVRTGIREFDYPKGDDNVYRHYDGDGGIPLDNIWKRLLFTIDEGDVDILLSQYIKPTSRIQIRQRVQERVASIAPFLRLDSDPYLVLNQGRLLWIQDAYTASDRYPYSEEFSAHNRRRVGNMAGGRTLHGRRSAFSTPANYIRNSVKIVVDAVDGNVSFYIVDDNEPILAAWRSAFPTMFKPLDALPAGLKAHLRYPQDLFEAQVVRYGAYHMKKPQVFYNKEDLWTIPQEKYSGVSEPMEPYYILVRLPGEKRMQFLLMTPYTPDNRDNMVAWMAARNDFPDYGQLVVFKLPKERLTYGPMQIEAMIDQDTAISRQLSLWDQRGSKVIRGNLLVIPIENSLIYVEPVYLVAEQHDVPQLKRVLVAYGDRVMMRPTLDGALAALFSEAPEKQSVKTASQPVMPTVIPEISSLMRKAQNAMAQGDWEAFGKAMAELKTVLPQFQSVPGTGKQSGKPSQDRGL